MALCTFSSKLAMDGFTVIDNVFLNEFLPGATGDDVKVYLYGLTLCSNPNTDDNTLDTICKVLSFKGNVFGVECPTFVDLVVTSTEPGFAGNTATNTLKPATLETGAEVKVPLFINEGEKIQIDTRTGEYLGRSKE